MLDGGSDGAMLDGGRDQGPPAAPDLGPETFCYDDEVRFPTDDLDVGECRLLEFVASNAERCLLEWPRGVVTIAGAVAVAAGPGEAFGIGARLLRSEPPGGPAALFGHTPGHDFWPACDCGSTGSWLAGSTNDVPQDDGWIRRRVADGTDVPWHILVLVPGGSLWEVEVCRER